MTDRHQNKGRLTIPTDVDIVPQTLELMERWGADALRDPGQHQAVHGRGEAAPQRGEGEDGEAGQVEPAGAVAVAEPAGDEQRHGVGQ